jgi:Domain of unknown function (DUF397)
MRKRTLGNPQERTSSDPDLEKSSVSFANGDRIEAASLPDGGIALRDSENAEGTVLRFTSPQWHAFLALARPDDGQRNMARRTLGGLRERTSSDRSWKKSSASFANGNCIEVASLPDGGIALRDSENAEGTVLRFTSAEWHAFLALARSDS